MHKLKLIPYPVKVELAQGFKSCNCLVLNGEDCFEKQDMQKYLLSQGLCNGENGVPVRFCIDRSMAKEAYGIDINDKGIDIKAGDNAGLFYAFVTLKQLLFNYNNNLPQCSIYDYPTFAYRGFMLDVGRYYFCKEDIFKIIDLCVMHKINVFHWHLTEDQGWRLQIDKYPLLTQKGSRRSHTNFGFKPHGGYYTKNDIKEIIKYCNDRHIQVIPEIDMPGHMQAALASYPHLGCFDRKLEVATHSGVKHDILCAGKQSSYQFVFDVIDEVAELFKDNSKYIHLGGDEALKMRWELCPHCRKEMQENNIDTANGLQAHFMQKVAQYATEKGLIPVMWNETDLSLPCHEKMVWQIWTTDNYKLSVEDIAKTADKRGGVINSDSTFAYLDLPYSDISLKKSYEFEPVIKGVEKFIGSEVALWTEYVPDFKTACKRMLPRLCALSECLWGKRDDFEGFLVRLKDMVKYLEKFGYKSVGYKTAMPSKFRAFIQKMWFERRQLHWQGLHNLIDDAKVASKYGKKQKN